MSDHHLLVVVRFGFENAKYLNSFIGSLAVPPKRCLVTLNGFQAMSSVQRGVSQMIVIDCTLDETTEALTRHFARMVRDENEKARIVRLSAIELEDREPFDDVVVVGHPSEYPRLGNVINQFLSFQDEAASV